MQDATLCLIAGYYASQRTRLIRTGAILAGAVNVLVVAMVFGIFAVNTPASVLLLIRRPAFVFFPSVYGLMGLGFGAATGSLGGVVGRWLPPPARGRYRHLTRMIRTFTAHVRTGRNSSGAEVSR